MELAPIVLFVYNRPDHTLKTIEALKRNKLSSMSELYIFSDGAKNNKEIEKIKEVRNIIKDIKGFKNIHIKLSKKNNGLANSVINGVTEVINKYKKVIVLEDDLVTSEDFLEYMNEALDFYERNKNIWAISAFTPPIKIPKNYNHDIYLSYRSWSWGYATWQDRWEKTDWNVSDYKQFLKNNNKKKLFNRCGNGMVSMLKSQMNGICDSWYVRWSYSQFRNNSYCVYPVKNKVKNLGLDGSGTHSFLKRIKKHKFCCEQFNQKIKLEELNLNEDIMREFKKVNDLTFKNYLGIILIKLGIYKQTKKILSNFIK